MSEIESPSRRITREVVSWPGVHAARGERGELGFWVGRQELGHLHGDGAAHFSFPKQTGARLREEGRVGPHPVAPESPALAARRIAVEDDVHVVIELLRLNYDRFVARHGVPESVDWKETANTG
jgi:hypothetical protein